MIRHSHIRLALSVLVVFRLGSSAAFGETIHDLRAWVSATGQGPLAHVSPSSALSRWRWYFDVQTRNRNTAHDIDQFVVRPAVGYAITGRSSVWVGYAYTANFTAGGKVYENRSWEQFVFTTPAKLSSVSLRSRMEQRFFSGAGKTGWRFRQQVRWSRPFAAKSSVSVIAWEEVLFHLNTTARTQRGFDQNRSFAGLGFKLNSKLRLDFGYLNQFVHSTPANRMNHALSGVVNLSF